MTLTTRIRVLDPHPVKAIFDEARRILRAGEAEFVHGEAAYGPDGKPRNMRYANNPGQGLAALLWVEYGVDAPLSLYDDDTGPQGVSIEVSFDTAYGYRNSLGGSCSDAHAYLIQEIGRYFTHQRLTWWWEDEFTGEWFSGSIPPDSLGDTERGAALDD